MRQLIFKGSDNLVTTLTSVLPGSRNMFTRLCGCRIVSIHISDIAEDPSPNHLFSFLEESLCSLFNEWGYNTWAPLTFFHHPFDSSNTCLTFLPRETSPSVLSFHPFLPHLGTTWHQSSRSFSYLQNFTFLDECTFPSALIFKSFPTLTKSLLLTVFPQATILTLSFPPCHQNYTSKFLLTSFYHLT